MGRPSLYNPWDKHNGPGNHPGPWNPNPWIPPQPNPCQELRSFSSQSGMFTYSSDARAGLDTAAQTLVRHGKLVLEARLNGNSFSVSYLERVY